MKQASFYPVIKPLLLAFLVFFSVGLGAEPLHEAAERGDVDEVLQLLRALANPAALNSHKETPLHLAAFKGHLKVMKLLIERGSDLEAVDENGYTSLILAAKGGYQDAVELLLQKGGKLNARDFNERTVLHILLDEPQSFDAELSIFLIRKDAQVNVWDKNGLTPLHLAAKHGLTNIVEQLLSNKAEINARDKQRRTALSFAAEEGHLDVLTLLLTKEAELEIRDKSGKTPLDYAEENGHFVVVEIIKGIQDDLKALAETADHEKPIEATEVKEEAESANPPETDPASTVPAIIDETSPDRTETSVGD